MIGACGSIAAFSASGWIALAEAVVLAVCVAVGMADGLACAGPVVGDPTDANDATAPSNPPGCVGTVFLAIGDATVAGWFVCGVPANWPNNDPARLLDLAPAAGADLPLAGELARGLAWGIEGVPTLTLLSVALFGMLPNSIRHIPPMPCDASSCGGE